MHRRRDRVLPAPHRPFLRLIRWYGAKTSSGKLQHLAQFCVVAVEGSRAQILNYQCDVFLGQKASAYACKSRSMPLRRIVPPTNRKTNPWLFGGRVAGPSGRKISGSTACRRHELGPVKLQPRDCAASELRRSPYFVDLRLDFLDPAKWERPYAPKAKCRRVFPKLAAQNPEATGAGWSNPRVPVGGSRFSPMSHRLSALAWELWAKLCDRELSQIGVIQGVLGRWLD